jgi:hypothetical protein
VQKFFRCLTARFAQARRKNFIAHRKIFCARAFRAIIGKIQIVLDSPIQNARRMVRDVARRWCSCVARRVAHACAFERDATREAARVHLPLSGVDAFFVVL